MPVPIPQPHVRVAGVSLTPGHARLVAVGTADADAKDPGDKTAARAIPAWVALGRETGPRVTVLAAPRGCEAAAALAAQRLTTTLTPADLKGSLTVVPVFVPGGRLTGDGRPIARDRRWQFPGDAAGKRRAREAFTLFADLCVGSDLVCVLSAAPGGRRSALVVRGQLDDPHCRRLMLDMHADAARNARFRTGSLGAALAEVGGRLLEVSCGGAGTLEEDAGRLLAASLRLLSALGVLTTAAAPSPGRPTPVLDRFVWVRAAHAGVLHQSAPPGTWIPPGRHLGAIVPLSPGTAETSATALVNPDGRTRLVLESPGRSVTREGQRLFLLGAGRRARGARPATRGTPLPAADEPRTLELGWVEWASLPALGLERVRAKLDTGARTAALHVTSMRKIEDEDGRSWLEITVPKKRRGHRRPLRLRVSVREHITVRDTSGRMETRPVIETSLRLGPITRRIRVALTNRGDMLFPVLLGRTALGPGVVVSASKRHLLTGRHPTMANRMPRPVSPQTPKSAPGKTRRPAPA